jgi:site-specific recombinase XerD
MKRAQLAIFEASAKIFRRDRKTPTCPTAMRVWTPGRIEKANVGGEWLVSERGAPFSTAGFARMLERAAKAARMPIKVHPHMLRHACGFALANAGHDTRAVQAYLGHKNIQHTVRYTELSSARFKNFWRD